MENASYNPVRSPGIVSLYPGPLRRSPSRSPWSPPTRHHDKRGQIQSVASPPMRLYYTKAERAALIVGQVETGGVVRCHSLPFAQSLSKPVFLAFQWLGALLGFTA